jgi:DNA-binding transcriptional regulator GbsR (MarR family)
MTATDRLPPELLHDPPANEEELQRLVERMAGRFVSLGMPRMPARVLFTILASTEGALTAAEIGQRLAVSPAAVSKAVQYLIQAHIAHREYVRGSRKDLYRVGKDHWGELMRFRAHLMKVLCDDLAEASEKAGVDTPVGERLAELRSFYTFAMEETASLYDRWRAAQARS